MIVTIPQVNSMAELTPIELARAQHFNNLNAIQINARAGLTPQQKEEIIEGLARRTNEAAMERRFLRAEVNYGADGMNLITASPETLYEAFRNPTKCERILKITILALIALTCIAIFTVYPLAGALAAVVALKNVYLSNANNTVSRNLVVGGIVGGIAGLAYGGFSTLNSLVMPLI